MFDSVPYSFLTLCFARRDITPQPVWLRGCAACRGTGGAPVAYYRCYFLDSDNHVRSTDVITCENDAQAQARANLILHCCGYPGIEVWDRPDGVSGTGYRLNVIVTLAQMGENPYVRRYVVPLGFGAEFRSRTVGTRLPANALWTGPRDWPFGRTVGHNHRNRRIASVGVPQLLSEGGWEPNRFGVVDAREAISASLSP